MSRKLTYISLFSSAGVGCFGFKQNGFECIATNEIIERRLKIQEYNRKCKYTSGYIAGDIRDEETKSCILSELQKWKEVENVDGLDVLIATPPCQGMSVANHKKGDEKNRNSLVIESIKLVLFTKPKVFIFENVKSFLKTLCTNLDGEEMTIKDAIEQNLAGHYNILSKVINFKEYGNNSSRTRTVIIGVRKDIEDITPYDLFPDKTKEITLRQAIGHLPSLSIMGDVLKGDIYHNFRPYSKHMEEWIKDIKEGQSAFDNIDKMKIPHKIVKGEVIYNQNKNGDKYTRCYWDKVAPCVHTRNDILASQATIHPVDNRVFSIRELMIMMTIPEEFVWSNKSNAELNDLSIEDKALFLSKEEINIRQSIGEAVPTTIFYQIGKKIKQEFTKKKLKNVEVVSLIKKYELDNPDNLKEFVKSNFAKYDFSDLSKIIELANSKRQHHSAFYTRQDVCFNIVNSLPDFGLESVKILEPSVGVGNFLPLIIEKYKEHKNVEVDLIDIDINALELLKLLIAKLDIPKNFHFRFINKDFLLYKSEKQYDLVIGNPPFGKKTDDKKVLLEYKKDKFNTNTNNLFSFFVEKSIALGKIVALILPKSILGSPEFNKTRMLLESNRILSIKDYGEKAFKGVKIETVSLILENNSNKSNVSIESYIDSTYRIANQDYICSADYPSWIIYRNKQFDDIAEKLDFNIFTSFRDRTITKKITKERGNYRVLKSRNIGSNYIIDISGYDTYIDVVDNLSIKKYLNKSVVIVPNLTYKLRACFLPKNCIADGSVAILEPKQGITISEEDLEYYNTEEFSFFYTIARNKGTRSLNIDSNSVFFWGKLKK